jgi:hypothetical protein
MDIVSVHAPLLHPEIAVAAMLKDLTLRFGKLDP